MWIPKTNDELKKLLKEKEKTARITGLAGALMVIITLIVDAKYIGVKIEKFPVSSNQISYFVSCLSVYSFCIISTI